MATNNAINLNASGLAKYDGAGVFTATTTTNHAVLVGGAANAIGNIGPLTNGQLAIGSTGANPVAATITPGVGISITNSAGGIQIDALGGSLTWTVEAANAGLVVGHGYGSNKAGALAFTLPASAAVGSVISIIGMINSWNVVQNALQTIHIGSAASTTGIAGSISSTNAGDCIELVCLIADKDFYAVSVQGNITVA